MARATLATGVIRGKTKSRLNELFEQIRKVWAESVKGLNVKHGPMVALDVDEPLWHLSKYGCTYRDQVTGFVLSSGKCEAKEFCIKGTIGISNSFIELDT